MIHPNYMNDYAVLGVELLAAKCSVIVHPTVNYGVSAMCVGQSTTTI